MYITEIKEQRTRFMDLLLIDDPQSIAGDFFTDHYDEPIFENGSQCRDMIFLEMDL